MTDFELEAGQASRGRPAASIEGIPDNRSEANVVQGGCAPSVPPASDSTIEFSNQPHLFKNRNLDLNPNY